MTDPQQNETPESEQQPAPNTDTWYRIHFRKDGAEFTAASRMKNLKSGEVAMAQTEKGLEPAWIVGAGQPMPVVASNKSLATYTLLRRGTREETEKFERLIAREGEAFEICAKHIAKHELAMKLIRVERFFNGSKIIFYFTAENRVDFRELVKDLVQEFRTRVEIRQVGVRHETKMIGGLGCCGRELCCSSFIKNFAPVSIKMAKEQNLSLNPAKISGLCNRLLCCLTYEFDTYHAIRKHMPKLGKAILLDGETWKVIHNNVLEETVTVLNPDDPKSQRVLERADWVRAEPLHKPQKKRPSRGGKQPQKGKSEKA